MAVNLCAAHKKTDSRVANKVLLTCTTQSLTCALLTIMQHIKYGLCAACKIWLTCSTQSLTRMQHITCHTRVLTESLERTHMYSAQVSVNCELCCTVISQTKLTVTCILHINIQVCGRPIILHLLICLFYPL